MSATDILRKARPKQDIQPINLALPSIPTATQAYAPQTNKANPEDYLVDIIKGLPINVQHLSNSTNGYAYTSMADVLLNKEAWKKRWGEDSWLNTALGYLPRVVADTILLGKHTIANPIVDSIKLANSDPNDNYGFFKGLQAKSYDS